MSALEMEFVILK